MKSCGEAASPNSSPRDTIGAAFGRFFLIGLDMSSPYAGNKSRVG